MQLQRKLGACCMPFQDNLVLSTEFIDFRKAFDVIDHEHLRPLPTSRKH